MKYPSRIYYTETDKALMWDRWHKGESLHSIAGHFGRSHSALDSHNLSFERLLYPRKQTLG